MPKAFRWLAAASVPLAALGVFSPSLRFELMGDDYQMVQLAHEAAHRPAKLLAPIGEFFRPASTWTLVADRAIWRHNPAGFHLTNLLLHLVATFLLVAVARKLGLSYVTSWLAGLFWACSPFVAEVAISVGVRHEQTLLIAWLLMVLAWPSKAERWSRSSVLLAVGAGGLAVASKETWVVTPGLVLVLELLVLEHHWRRAVLVAAPLAGLATIATVTRLLLVPTFGSYYSLSLRPLAKIPNIVAAFFRFEELSPVPQIVTWRGAVGCAVLLVLIAFAWRKRLQPALLGVALFVLPLLPALPIPYLPLRYTHIAYAGFVMLIAGCAQALDQLPATRLRTWARLAGATALAIVLASDVLGVRATLEDADRVSKAHRRLLAEATRVAASLPLDRAIVVLRIESENPLLDVVEKPRGLPQPWFQRNEDPYGLIDAGALFDWTRRDERVRFARIDDWSRVSGQAGVLTAHVSGGFLVPPESVPDAAAAAHAWQARGVHVRVIQAEALP